MASPKSSHFRHATSGLEGSRVQPLRDEGLSLRPATAWEITRGSTAEKDHAEGTRKRRASDVDGSSTRMVAKGGTKLIPEISMAPIRAQRSSKKDKNKGRENGGLFGERSNLWGARERNNRRREARLRSDGDRETKSLSPPPSPSLLSDRRECSVA